MKTLKEIYSGLRKFRYYGYYKKLIVNLVCLFLLILISGFPNLAKGQNVDLQWWNAMVFDWNFSQAWVVEVELDYNRLLCNIRNSVE